MNYQFGNMTASDHGAEQLFQRGQLSRGGPKCQTDHISRNEVGCIVAVEGVRRIEEQPPVTVDQVSLDSLSLITVAFGPDEPQHLADADSRRFHLVGIDDNEEVHGLDDFALVFGRE